MQPGRRRGSGALGWLLFALIIFAPRLATPLSTWLAQVAGINIAPGIIIAGLTGLYVIAVVVVPAIRNIGRSRGAGDTRLPTSAMPPPSALPQPTQPPPTALPQRPAASAPPAMRLSNRPAHLPGPPRFEPIISPRVLTLAIVGLLALGALLLGALFFSGLLP